MFSLPLQPAKQLGPSQNLIRGVRGDVLVASAAINVLSLALPIVILQVYDRVIPNRSTQTLAFLLIGLVVALVLDLVLTIARTYLSGWSSARIQHKLGCDVVGHMFQSDLKVFELTSVGQHLQRLRAIDTLKSVFAGQGLLILVDLPFAFLFFGLIGLIAGPLALVPAAIALVLAFAAQSAGLRLERAMEERNASDNRRYNFIIEVLKTIYTIKALGMESMMARRYERLQSNSAAATCAVSDTSTWARTTGQFFSQLTTISVAAYGTWLVVGGNLTVGGLAACTLLASRASQPMMRALGLFTQLRKGGVALSLVEQAMSLPPESRDGAPGFGEIKGDVRLEHVSFSYTRDSRPIFRDVCLDLKSDETVAIMGANGSGKSTLLGLMMGLLMPSSGRVSIDGIDIWERDAASLRAHVIHLPQRPTLFQGTILDNLTMFRGEECLDEAMRIGERLGLHEVIGRMPEGYETRIEHAANDGLPGGVRQRIALVRALTMVREPRLILFDEANAYLDEKSDGLLLEELRARKGKCAIAIVSHRPSYLSLGDRAYVIRDGALVPGPEGARVTLERLQRMLEQ